MVERRLNYINLATEPVKNKAKQKTQTKVMAEYTMKSGADAKLPLTPLFSLTPSLSRTPLFPLTLFVFPSVVSPSVPPTTS